MALPSPSSAGSSAFSFFPDAPAGLESLLSPSGAAGGAFAHARAQRHGASSPERERFACASCARPLSGRCGFCSAAGGAGAAACDSCAPQCDGCGRPACEGCAEARLSVCSECRYTACDECCTQPDMDADDSKEAGPRGCWCDSERKRDVGNRRFVSRERYMVQQLTHPSMRASSLAAAGLADDDIDGACDAAAGGEGGGYYDDGFGSYDGGSGGGGGDGGSLESSAPRLPTCAGLTGLGSAGASGNYSGLLGALGARHAGLDLAASDGGSAVRRAMQRYGAPGARGARRALY